MKYTIYILKLENNKYYVGKTKNLQGRLNNHKSKWTQVHRPIGLYKQISNCDSYDEDKYTLKMMNKFGIDNVRGGSYCMIYIPIRAHIEIQKYITK